MARAKRKKVTFITRPTPRVTRVLELVSAASVVYDRYVQEWAARWGTPDAEAEYEAQANAGQNMREGLYVSQQGHVMVCRFQAALSAWQRGAKWASEERLEKDGMAFVDFVRAECMPLAEVVPLRRHG